MRKLALILMTLTLGFAMASAAEVEGRVIKVLPQFLDKKGRASLSPSLYDRDAYQAYLRKTVTNRVAMQYAVQWKAKAPTNEPLSLRVELRGLLENDAPKKATFEFPVTQSHWWSHWSYLVIKHEDYQKFGEVTAWRVTLWDGNKQLSEQQSFLW